MTTIKPILAGFPQVEANEIFIQSMPFPLGATESQVYWKLLNVVIEQVEVSYSEFVEATEDAEAHNVQGTRFDDVRRETVLSEGNVFIPQEVHEKWLSDDTIIDYVLAELGLERAG